VAVDGSDHEVLEEESGHFSLLLADEPDLTEKSAAATGQNRPTMRIIMTKYRSVGQPPEANFDISLISRRRVP
jgi:hypothetical protein